MPVKIIEGENMPRVKTAEVVIDEDGNVIVIARTRLIMNLMEGRSDHYVTEAPTPRFGSFEHVGSRKLAHVSIDNPHFVLRGVRAKPNAKKSPRKKFRSKYWRRLDASLLEHDGG